MKGSDLLNIVWLVLKRVKCVKCAKSARLQIPTLYTTSPQETQFYNYHFFHLSIKLRFQKRKSTNQNQIVTRN